MEIQPGNRISPPLVRVPRASRPATGGAADACEFTGAESLQQALAATPEVRPEAVERGRALLATPGYPSREVLSGVAGRLASALDPAGSGVDGAPAEGANHPL